MSTAPTPVRWGVLGVTSYVAQRAVLPALRDSEAAELVAVASRSHDAAHLARAEYGAAAAYDGYEALIDDPSVEAVYIPLPNGLHREWTLRCAQAGKHVLCEKPLALTATDASEMAAACAEAGVLLMEAYMTPFHPRHAELVRVARSELGALESAHAAFTFPLRDARNHRWDPHLGGGALLDVGVYCLAPLLEIAGDDPVEVGATARHTETGVDATTTGWLRFDSFLARFECSFEAAEQQVIEVGGTEATVRATHIFTGMHDDVDLQVHRHGEAPELRRTAGADPYQLMVEHFAAAVRGAEPLRRGPEESVRVLRLIDVLRAGARDSGSA